MVGGWKMCVGGVVVTWAVMGAVVGAREVVCGRECTCWSTTNLPKEYRVICNSTSHQVTLTEAVFAQRTIFDTRTYVRVEAPSESTAVTVTEEFVRNWRQQVYSSLDVWGGRLFLPQMESLGEDDIPFSTVSGGVGLINVSMDVLPGGLFGEKKDAKLRLSGCWVGRIAAGLLREVKHLQYLQIEDSTVGVFEGPLGDDQLSLNPQKEPKYSKSPILVHNSKFGVLDTGALRIHINNENTILTEVKVGEMKEGAVEVSGPGKVELSRCSVADLHQDAIKLHGGASVSITNSSLMVQSGALSQFPCHFYQHHINSNNILVLPAVAAGEADDLLNVSITPPDSVLLSESRHSVEELVREELGKALDPTCVEGNLPPWLSSLAEPILPQPRREKHALLHTGLYSFVGVSVAAMIIVVILTCLLVKVRRRRAPTCSSNQVVVMSHLSEDPIYEEPGHLTLLPPPVPPPSALLDDVCSGKQDSCCGAATAPNMNDYCASHPDQRPQVKAVENQYMSMC